jgi:hypothetical protein
MMTPTTEEMNLLVINPRNIKLQTHPLWLLQYITVPIVREWRLVAGRCHARTQARKYNDRWVIWYGARTCKCTGHKGKQEKGAVGKPVFYVAVYKKGGKKKPAPLQSAPTPQGPYGEFYTVRERRARAHGAR